MIPVFKVGNLILVIGDKRIVNVSALELFKNEILGIIGLNGSGKSSLLKMLSFLVNPSEGVIEFQGKPVNSGIDKVELRRRVTLIFDEPLLFDTTVFENVVSGLKLRRENIESCKEKGNFWLNKFGIFHLKKRRAKTLSAGESQRVNLARAFAVSPEVILMDEPFSNLDPVTRESLIDDLQSIFNESGISGIFVTHDRGEALMLSDRIAVMDAGEILQTGTPYEVFSKPANETVAELVGVETILNGRVSKKDDEVLTITVDGGGEIKGIGDYSMNERVLVCIRPEDVVIERGDLPVDRISAKNIFHCVMENISTKGMFYSAALSCPFPLKTYLTKQSVKQLNLKEGEAVTAFFKATAVHLIRKR